VLFRFEKGDSIWYKYRGFWGDFFSFHHCKKVVQNCNLLLDKWGGRGIIKKGIMKKSTGMLVIWKSSCRYISSPKAIGGEFKCRTNIRYNPREA